MALFFNKILNQQKDVIEVEGIVLEAMPSAKFRVKLIDQEHEVLGYISGKMRLHRIRLMPGDRVRMEMSPYDLKKGRIVYRYKVGDRRPNFGSAEVTEEKAAGHFVRKEKVEEKKEEEIKKEIQEVR